MGSSIPAKLRRLVHERAGGRCEYCLLHENHSPVAHEIDHLVARKHGGLTTSDNLALACLTCNQFKADRFLAVDPHTNETVPCTTRELRIGMNIFVGILIVLTSSD